MSFIKDLLWLIEEFGEVLPRYKASYQFGTIPQGTFYKSLKRLETRGLIKKKRKADRQVVYVLTKKGKYLTKKQALKSKREDGLSTLIIFDIPEEMNRQRNIFRRFLIRNGYTLIQKSVLISPDKPLKEIFELIRELGISTFVTLLSGKIDHYKI